LKAERALRTLGFVVLPLALSVVTVLVSYLILGSWWIELLSFFMPLVMGSALVLFALALWRGTKLIHLLAPSLLMLLVMKPISETIAINLPKASNRADLTVMSFNAALFNPYRPNTLESEPVRYTDLYTFLRSHHTPDVLCIQEFYHGVKDDLELAIDSIAILGGYTNFYMNPRYDRDYDGLTGVATYSKYPAVNSGRLDFGSEPSANGHWNDLRVGNDTVRVVNMQLQSMSIRWETRDAHSWSRNLWANVVHFHQRLRWGYHRRSLELDAITAFLQESPHPLIICADINALPYSDTYQTLKRLAHNAFERGGRGTGFTYYHFPWFIRIDNQFFDRTLDITYFRTRRDIRISDHYPIEAGYSFRERAHPEQGRGSAQ